MGDKLAFPDQGLHIAVLGQLLESDAIQAETIEKLLMGISSKRTEKTRLMEAVRRLHGLAIQRRFLQLIESLDFDGGNQIYMVLEQCASVNTGGESDYYELKALTGIEALRSLRKLSLDGYGYRESELDLAPLANHQVLQDLELSGRCKSSRVLVTLPKLMRLDVRNATVDDPKILRKLVDSRVEVVGLD